MDTAPEREHLLVSWKKKIELSYGQSKETDL